MQAKNDTKLDDLVENIAVLADAIAVGIETARNLLQHVLDTYSVGAQLSQTQWAIDRLADLASDLCAEAKAAEAATSAEDVLAAG